MEQNHFHFSSYCPIVWFCILWFLIQMNLYKSNKRTEQLKSSVVYECNEVKISFNSILYTALFL
jgi:preprotein translocase subunit YajC